MALLNKDGATNSSSWISEADALLKRFLNRVLEVDKIPHLNNCDIYLPHLGPYLMCEEFLARDYKEGQQHRVALFLFTKGIIMAMVLHKGIRVFQKTVAYDFDSFYSLDQVALDEQANCFRLKDPHSRLTCYKIICKKEFLRSDSKSLMDFIARIRKLQDVLHRSVFRLNEASCDLGDREALNLRLVQGISRELASKESLAPNLSIHPFVEVINIPLCRRLVLESQAKLGFIVHHRMEKFNRWLEIRKIEEESWPRGRRVLDRFRILCRRKSTVRYVNTIASAADSCCD